MRTIFLILIFSIHSIGNAQEVISVSLLSKSLEYSKVDNEIKEISYTITNNSKKNIVFALDVKGWDCYEDANDYYIDENFNNKEFYYPPVNEIVKPRLIINNQADEIIHSYSEYNSKGWLLEEEQMKRTTAYNDRKELFVKQLNEFAESEGVFNLQKAFIKRSISENLIFLNAGQSIQITQKINFNLIRTEDGETGLGYNLFSNNIYEYKIKIHLNKKFISKYVTKALRTKIQKNNFEIINGDFLSDIGILYVK
ncbi:MAG: hypothetical protein KUL74_03035 [Cloacibacterium sp.]|nr:hypothetical protein [Cloacibacterium sp.]